MIRLFAVSLLLASPAHASDDPGLLQLVIGHGTGANFDIFGRLIEDEGLAKPRADSSRLRNVYEAAKLLESDEIEDAVVEVRIGPHTLRATTDDEGVFAIRMRDAKPPLEQGMHYAEVKVIEDRGHPTPPAKVVVHILAPSPGVAIISDFDDTVAVTQVTSKRAMIRNAVLKNAAQITAVQGVGPAYQAAVNAGARLVFYVSGSPQNFLPRLETYIARENLPQGPILLKDFGTDPLFDQVGYKVGRIRRVLELHPTLRFILIGDSGERDPEIYAQVRGQYPDRILGIVIRKVPGAKETPGRFTGMITVAHFAEKPTLLSDMVRAALAK